MPAVFALMSTSDHLFQFDYRNSAGEQVMCSAKFSSKAEAEQAIQEVRVGSMMSQMISVGVTQDGKKFFAIKNAGGATLVQSVPFANELSFNNALHAVRDGACIAEIEDATA